MKYTWNNPIPQIIEHYKPDLIAFAQEVKANVIEESFKPKHGRRGRVRRSSAPGESFATQSGHYVENIEIVTTSDGVIVGVQNVPYAADLEKTRPTWEKAIRKAARNRRRRRR